MMRDNIVGTLQGDSRLSGGLSVGGSTTDYNMLGNKPKINNVELVGNKNSADLGLEPAINYPDDQTKYYNGRGQWTTPPSGVTSYNDLTDKPSINGVTLSGNKTADDLELSSKGQFNSLSGVIVSFNDGQDLPLAKCIADIEATQNLHGYDKPWAGGAGKNLFPMTVNEIKTKNVNISWNGNVGIVDGATITLHTDDGISVSKISISGAPTNTVYLYVGAFNLKSGVSYVLNGCPSNKPDNNVLYVSNQPSGFGDWIDRGHGATYNATQDWNGISFYIRMWKNEAQNNDWYPMIRLATETDATFEPYSNICPISGSTSVTVTVSDGETSTTKTTPLGQTVYGGQLNVLTGELTIDRGFITITSESQLTTFTYNVENGSFSQVASGGKISNAKVMCISNMMEGIAFNNRAASAYVDVDRCYSDETGKIRIRNRNSVTINTKTDLFARFEGAEICYFLATPQTVQLTPQEVNSLLGQNNISADTGDISITYINNVNDPIIKYILNNM